MVMRASWSEEAAIEVFLLMLGGGEILWGYMAT